MILQALMQQPNDSPGYASESELRERTRISRSDLKDWLETLEGEGLVDVAKTEAGYAASITSKGRLIVGSYGPTTPSAVSDSSAGTPTEASLLRNEIGSMVAKAIRVAPQLDRAEMSKLLVFVREAIEVVNQAFTDIDRIIVRFQKVTPQFS
jgi:DNA-binding MarR family transcriptional regulator